MEKQALLLSLTAVAITLLLISLQPESNSQLLLKKHQITEFATFRSEFKRRYNSESETEYRFMVFQSNLNLIESHNINSLKTYSLAVNEFADMTFEEFSSKYLGSENGEFSQLNIKPTYLDPTNLGEETEVDWNKKGVVRPPRNQGLCNSCWAFTAVSAMESALAIFLGQKELNLSEQELLDCSGDYDNKGCWGGWSSNAYKYIKEHGVNLGNDYPYNSKAGECKKDLFDKGPYRVKGHTFIPLGVEHVVTATRKQPAAVSMAVIPAFMFYRSGVYNPGSCGTTTNHSVTVVGFKLDAELPYFIVKNSWGTIWGEKGFFRIAIGKAQGTCHMGSSVYNCYPQV